MEFNLRIKQKSQDKVILEDEEHNLITWPKNKIPQNLKVGDNLKISINQASGKKILNEILRIDKKNQ